MTQPLNEGQHIGEFIVGELAVAGGQISRDKATLTSGQKLTDGTLLQLTGGKLVAKATNLNTAGAFIVPIEGILIGNWDASATGTNADIPGVPYIARIAAVDTTKLVFPAGSPQKAEAIAELRSKLNIVCR